MDTFLAKRLYTTEKCNKKHKIICKSYICRMGHIHTVFEAVDFIEYRILHVTLYSRDNETFSYIILRLNKELPEVDSCYDDASVSWETIL